MTTPLNPDTRQKLEQLLEERDKELRSEIREELLRANSEHYADLAGQVHDPEESSVADLLVDLNLATIEKHVAELRQVETALARLKEGEYGTCIDCGAPIGEARLLANPVAQRCIRCQEVWEKTHAGTETPAL